MSDVSLSFDRLRQLARSFEHAGTQDAAPDPRRERHALVLADELGATALPLCLRELASADERRACWARLLLAHLGSVPAHRPRVLAGLRDLARRNDAGGLRAMALRAELEPPAAPPVSPVDALREQIAGLASPADVALAAHRLVIDLDEADMLDLLDALSDSDPRRALLLTDELLLRNDLGERCRVALRRVHAPLDDRRHTLGAHWPPRPRAGRSPAITVRLGRHESGRMVLIASRAVPGSRPRRLRVLGALLAQDGTLRDGLHGDDFTQARLERELLAPLRRSGYVLADSSAPKAAALLRKAAQASLRLGRLLPQAFYLGRDVLGLYDEHTTGLRTRGGPAAMLDRAMDLLDGGHVRRARPILERYVAQVPENAEGFAALARCLIELGEHDRARAGLLRAIWLDPDNPSHHWNLAAVAHAQGRDGGCYLALIDYLILVGEHGFDQATGACEQRRELARRFVSEYQRVARLEHPAVEPDEVAQADDLLHRARLRLHKARWEEAIPMLEQAVVLVPSHYPSWAHLGIAQSECQRLDQARQCLHQALALRPSYPLAVAAMRHLDARVAPLSRAAGSLRRQGPLGMSAGTFAGAFARPLARPFTELEEGPPTPG